MEDTLERRTITNMAGGTIVNPSASDLAALAKAQYKRDQRSKKRHFVALSNRWRVEPHFLKLNVWAIEQDIPPGTVHEWAETFAASERRLLAKEWDGE